MFTHPGGKLLFMGNEFGQTSEWNYKTALDWHLLDFPAHKNLSNCVKDLCHLYRNHPAMYELQFDAAGFEWIDLDHRAESVIAYMRIGKDPNENILMVFNMTPVVRNHWKIKVSNKSNWKEIFNSNNLEYNGTGDVYNPAIQYITIDETKGLYELSIHLPALGAIALK
jgi:1,4-alpha-glucan branching enzyme